MPFSSGPQHDPDLDIGHLKVPQADMKDQMVREDQTRLYNCLNVADLLPKEVIEGDVRHVYETEYM
jgi:hypothetical protein